MVANCAVYMCVMIMKKKSESRNCSLSTCFLDLGKQQGSSYRSGGIALINGVFEVCAEFIKRNDLKKEEKRKGNKSRRMA